jgi:hypothetical protein
MAAAHKRSHAFSYQFFGGLGRLEFDVEALRDEEDGPHVVLAGVMEQ